MSSDWIVTTLGQTVSFKTGKLDSNASESSGTYPFFTCSPNTLQINNFAFDTEATILAGNNANGVFSIKHYCGKFNAYQRTYIIEPLDTEEVSCKFIYFAISDVIRHLQELAIGTSTKFLTKTILSSLKILLPSKREQDQITALLSALDDRITLIRESNTTLEATAQALFKSWFVDFDPVHAKQEGRAPEGMDTATAALFPHGFEESELGLFPRGWRLGLFGDIADTVRSQRQPSELNIDTKYVGLEHITRRCLSLLNWGTVEKLESAKSCFSKGDILFGKLRPYFHKVVIAPFDGVCSTDILVIQPKFQNYYGLVCMHLFSAALITYAERLSNGAKMPRVNWKDLAIYPIVLPPKNVAEKYTNAIDPLFKQILANTQQIQTLADLRDTILPRLISGQLRLPEDESKINKAA